MRQIKVGLVGAGYIFDVHAKALRSVEGVVLHAVVDKMLSKAQAAAERYNIPHAFDSIEAIADSDCDSVHILLPPSYHLDAANQLITAGKHVFLEKPMGTASTYCRQTSALASTYKVQLGVNHNFLFMPSYEPIRDAVRNRLVGDPDHLSLNWVYPLPLIQYGPFNNWILASPENLILELGPHLAAFALDLLGPVNTIVSHAGSPIDLPGESRVYRHWHMIGEAGRATVVVNMSVRPGQTDRSFKLRTSGALIQLDLERGIGSIEHSRSSDPIVDNLRTAFARGYTLACQASRSFGRHALSVLRKTPRDNPFAESVTESIQTFYRGLALGTVDPRHDGMFGAAVIELCEAISKCVVSETTRPNKRPQLSSTKSSIRASVLVVGGTGFIGRRLVQRLVQSGVGVRVLTRSVASARIELAGIEVDLLQGSHGDIELLDQALDGIEVVYHLAKTEGNRWSDYVERDIAPTRILAQAAIKCGVKRFIYTGTIDSYDSKKSSRVITNDTPLDPRLETRNYYARSKGACENILRELHQAQGLPLVIVRPGIVIGSDSHPAHGGVALFSSNSDVVYWGDGQNPIPLVLVDDVAEALALTREARDIEGRTLLLTDAPLMSAREYVAAVEKRAGLRFSARSCATWRHFVRDALRELVKHAIRHQNRRKPSLHDWACKAHRSKYDSRATQERLGWKPSGNKEKLIDGINASVDNFFR